MWEDVLCPYYSCMWVSNLVTKPAQCGLRGEKVSALHQHHPTFTVKECSQRCSVTCNQYLDAKPTYNLHPHLPSNTTHCTAPTPYSPDLIQA